MLRLSLTCTDSSWTEEAGMLSRCIFRNSLGLYSLGNWWTVHLENPKTECRKLFLSNGWDQIFLALAHLLYPKFQHLLSLLEWCEEYAIPHLWQYAKLSSGHLRAMPEISRLCRLLLINSHQSAVWLPILRTLLYYLQWYECVVWSCGKLRCCVHLPTDPKFHKSWTFGHIRELQASLISFLQSKRHLVSHFFHRCECLPASPRGICVPTNVRCIQASHLHHTHFVAICVYGQHRKILRCEKMCHSAYFTIHRYTPKRKLRVYLAIEHALLNQLLTLRTQWYNPKQHVLPVLP